jgi:hypothetical protein
MLIILSGLPGTGKTTFARQLAHALAAVYLRIDSIEQSMRAAGWPVEGEGSRVALPACRHSTSRSCVQTLASIGAAWRNARQISPATDCRRGRKWLREITVGGTANASSLIPHGRASKKVFARFSQTYPPAPSVPAPSDASHRCSSQLLYLFQTTVLHRVHIAWTISSGT